MRLLMGARLLGSHTLVQATAKDFVRHSQEQMIATPLLERLADAYGNADLRLERQLLVLLTLLARTAAHRAGVWTGATSSICCACCADSCAIFDAGASGDPADLPGRGGWRRTPAW